jgi:transcription factor Pcc1
LTRNLQRQLDVTVSVNVPFSNSSEAKAAVNALIPDNINFPKGLSIKIFSKGTMLAIQLIGKNVSTSTILNTLDEVLEHISVSKKVMAG